jgi:hypothetical protein
MSAPTNKRARPREEALALLGTVFKDAIAPTALPAETATATASSAAPSTTSCPASPNTTSSRPANSPSSPTSPAPYATGA